MAVPDEVDLVVHGGTVVDASGRAEATVAVTGGRIAAILDPELPLPPHARAVDARGRLVIPGGVDPHCHIGQLLGDYQALDDYQAATTAALWGGTTTVVDFAIPQPGQSPLDAVQQRRKLAEIARCDTALHGCVIDWDDTSAAQIEAMAGQGIRTIKLFTTYRDVVMAAPDVVLEVMRVLRAVGGIAYVHAEANHVVEDAQGLAAADDAASASHHPRTRPEVAELAAVTYSTA